MFAPYKTQLLGSAFALVAAGSVQGALVETQSFPDAATAAAAGWTASDNMGGTNQTDLGFSNTNNAGAAAGEAGRELVEDSPDPVALQYYGDITLGGELTESTAFTADGALETATDGNNTVDRGVLIGYFDKDAAGSLSNMAGVLVTVSSFQDRFSARAVLVLSDGTVRASGTNFIFETDSTGALGEVSNAFDIVYDPAGGVDGLGELTATITDTDTNTTLGTSTVSRNAGDAGFSVDTFGLAAGSVNGDYITGGLAGGNNADFDIFIDDLTYSGVVVPEPGTLALSMIGGALLLARRRNH